MLRHGLLHYSRPEERKWRSRLVPKELVKQCRFPSKTNKQKKKQASWWHEPYCSLQPIVLTQVNIC